MLNVVASSSHVLDAVLKPSGRRRLALATLGILTFVVLASAGPSRVVTVHAAGGPWLDRFNAWRSSSALATLTENAAWSQGDVNHSIYMVKNNLITHYETVGYPYYTPDGDAAGRNSNIYVSSSTSTQDVQAIDWWMQAPFHAMGMMDPRLTQTGFGSYREAIGTWQMAAVVDVRSGLSSSGRYPVYFPGNGSTEPLRTYGGYESPDPLVGNCAGYTAPTGLPVFVEIGGNTVTSAGPVHTFTGNGTPLEHCVLDSSSPGVASNLTYRGGVVLIPRQPLQVNVAYTVAVTVNGLPYTWSFTVGAAGTPVSIPPPPGWSSLGGVITAAPSASSWGASRVDVFVRGSDNGLYQNTWNGTAWIGWTGLGGVLTSSPAAVSWSANRIDAFVRGSDNALYHRVWDSGRWYDWEGLGGVLTSAPVAASWAPGRLDVFVRGTDMGLYHRAWDGQQWTAWEGLTGILTSDPSAVSSAANRLDVVVRGTDNGIWVKSLNGSGWSGWTSLGGGATSSPTIASCSSGHLDVFVRGTDNGLYHQGFNGTSWAAWTSVGGYWTTAPSAVCRRGTSTIDVFTRGLDNALWTGPATAT